MRNTALNYRPVCAAVIHLGEPTESALIIVRVSLEERALLEGASEQAHCILRDFVRGKAVDAAEGEMLERRFVTIPARDWDAFEAWASEPAREISALKEVAGKAPTWQR